MSGFSVSWLDLREPADMAARDKTIATHALGALGTGRIPLIVDLGAGTGSTLRALEALSTSALRWRLLDHDAALLATAHLRHGDSGRLETQQLDLRDVDALPLADATLVSASALFDLVSADVVDALSTRLAAAGIGLYAALNYDGTTQWEPVHPLDKAVLAAFNADQRRDKGLGPALGPDASACLAERFRAQGYELVMAQSPWQLGPQDATLVAALIEGIASAVSGRLSAEECDQWRAFRLQHVSQGRCIVGHTDLLALPPHRD